MCRIEATVLPLLVVIGVITLCRGLALPPALPQNLQSYPYQPDARQMALSLPHQDDLMRDQPQIPDEYVDRWRQLLSSLRRTTDTAPLVPDMQTNTDSDRQVAHNTARLIRQPTRRAKAIGINKRHCWDVADVCCMWNIC